MVQLVYHTTVAKDGNITRRHINRNIKQTDF
jgi:hypothetical protein